MTLLEETENGATFACTDEDRRCPVDEPAGKRLFERSWDEFVARLGPNGKYRNFVACCGILTPLT